MAGIISNENGKIYIDREVVAKIASQAAMECYGLVGMASKNKSTGIVELLQGTAGSKGIRVELTEESVNVELFVIIQYGTRISVVADNIIDRVKYYIENQTGLRVGKVDINVQGVRVQK